MLLERINFLSHLNIFAFASHTSLNYYSTCIHVRLLGPCYKTGLIRPFNQSIVPIVPIARLLYCNQPPINHKWKSSEISYNIIIRTTHESHSSTATVNGDISDVLSSNCLQKI